MLSPYDFWQYWRNTEDADVERFLKLYTTLPLDEIARLAALGGSEINEPRRSWRPKSPRCCTAAPQRSRQPRRRARPSRKARLPTPADGRSSGRRTESRHRPAVARRARRTGGVQRRGPPARPGRSRAHQRPAGQRRTPAVTAADLSPEGVSHSRSARSVRPASSCRSARRSIILFHACRSGRSRARISPWRHRCPCAPPG
jgi:tyrosyl-tRNA synthetase